MTSAASVSPKPIQVVLNEVKSAIGAVGKGERNSAQGFSFRGIDAVVNAAAPHLNEHGVITIPEVLDHVYETVEIGAKRTPMAHVTLKVRYVFHGPAGDSLCATVMSESMDSGDKAMAKAMSVAYRIALLQVLNLPTTETDPDMDVYERSGRPETRSEARPQAARNAPPAEPAKTGKTPTAAEIFENAKNAKTVDQARAAYRDAATHAMLDDKLPGMPGMTLGKYILQRGDDLSFRTGDSTAAAGGAGT